MQGYDWLMILGLLCAAVGGCSILGCVAADMKHAADRIHADIASKRKRYQRNIRFCIEQMVEDGDDDMEWILHGLLYEYRHGARHA